MSNIIEFPETKDPCICCGGEDNVRSTIYLYIDGSENTPKHYMLCGACAARHAVKCLEAVDEMLRTNQLIENEGE